MTNKNSSDSSEAPALTPEKREDLWAIIIAGMVLLGSVAAPDAVHNFFKNLLYIL